MLRLYVGFLLQWPTIPTLIMFPILVYVYARPARGEEREVAAQFGEHGPPTPSVRRFEASSVWLRSQAPANSCA